MALPQSLRAAPEAVALAVAFPALALHRDYSPDLALDVGQTAVSIGLADLALLVVTVAALSALRRGGSGPLRGALSILVPAALLLSLVALTALAGPWLSDEYPAAEKLVSAAKFLEYAALLVAVPLIVRRREDARVVVAGVLATGVAATTWGLLQLIGLLPNVDDVPAGRRMPSFAGYHDFAMISGLSLALGVAAVALGHPRAYRAWVAVAVASGTAGAIVAGAVSTVLALLVGIAFAVVAMWSRHVISWPRLGVLGAVALALLAGSAVMRSGDIADYIGFLGSDETTSADDVQTYSQRTVLAYIGFRIFLEHPLAGVGWQGSELPSNFEPVLGDARERFPEVSAEAFPSDAHRWGVQNAYVQAAADMGILGAVAAAWLALAGVIRAGRATLATRVRSPQLALAAAVAALVCAVEWAALGLVAGVPATAVLWLTLGACIAVGAPPAPPAAE